MKTQSIGTVGNSAPVKYAAAIGASLASTFEADAAIIYSGIQNIRLLNTNTSNSVGTALNIDGVGPADIVLSAFHTMTSTTVNSTMTYATFGAGIRVTTPTPGRLAPGGNGGMADVALGVSIGPTLFGQFAPVQANPAFIEYVSQSANVRSSGEFAPGVDGIIGLQFESNGNTHYGWVRLRVDDLNLIQLGGTTLADATVIDWAYEDTPNTAINAGATAVPEPSSLALLALGAAGLTTLRNRQSA